MRECAMCGPGGDSEEGRLAEEVLGVVHPAALGLGSLRQRLRQVERRHLEHLSGALAVGSGDEGRVAVDETLRAREGAVCVCVFTPVNKGGRGEVFCLFHTSRWKKECVA